MEGEESVVPEDVQKDSKISNTIALAELKGIGKATVEHLKKIGITTAHDLIQADPKAISPKINGSTPEKIVKWQESAKALLNA